MAQNFFIRIGDISGESQVEGHKGETQVQSWSHSFSQPSSPTRISNGGGTVEQANHADFSFTKSVDMTSVALMKLCWNGKTVPSAVFTAYRSDGDKLQEYLRAEMTNVIVSNLSVGGGTGDIPAETVTLSYSAVKYTGTPTSGQNAAPRSAKHDLGLQKVE